MREALRIPGVVGSRRSLLHDAARFFARLSPGAVGLAPSSSVLE